MSELNIFGLREYTRKDLFEDTTDEIREADRFYIMHEADAVIAEKDKEIAELKEFIENYRFDNKNMLHKIMNQDKKIRKLYRALWLARAELCRRLDVDRYLRKHRNSWYNENFLTWQDSCVAMEVKMCNAENKCRAKAEEYK